jgi:Ran GTPase-activating protein (RanGAP) involved in mRNA processing and transport
LEVLNLKKNDIGTQGIKSMEECLGLSKNLKELNLSNNDIGDEGVKLVLDSLQNPNKKK